MKIIKLKASNIKRLTAVEITPDGSVVKLTGKNASGKTSVLDAIFWAMSGTRNIQEKPIHEGQTKASIKLELGELTVERKFNSKGTTLRVTKQNGSPLTSPQKILDELIGNLTFDPLLFSKMAPKEQFEELRSIVTIDGNIDELDEKRLASFTRRTDVKRQFKELEAQRDNLYFPSINEVADEIIEPVEIIAKINLSIEHDKSLNEMRNSKESFERTGEILKNEIDSIKQKLFDLEEQLFRDEENVTKLNALIKEKGEAADIAGLQKELEEATGINNLVRQKLAFKEKKDACERAEQSIESLNATIEEVDEEKTRLMSTAKFPVEGLSFDEGIVLFNNVPFEQASSAEQLRVSMAMAISANPDFRVIRITDGSLMDSDSFKIIEEMADKHDFQVWVEVVDESGDVGIVIEDGHVKKVN